jgi:hypothetical protein
MADATFTGFLTPSQLNTGLVVFDTDSAPEQFSTTSSATDIVVESPVEQAAVVAAFDAAGPPLPANLLSLTMDASNNLVAVFDQPIIIDTGAETHVGEKWDFATPTISNTGTTGTLTQSLTRFLHRLSKLGRGVN